MSIVLLFFLGFLGVVLTWTGGIRVWQILLLASFMLLLANTSVGHGLADLVGRLVDASFGNVQSGG